MADNRNVGFAKEKDACEYLKKRGYKILERNFRTPFGEIDIIARHKKDLVFIEVKYRKDTYGGTPQEAVNRSKQQKIIKSAVLYIKQGAITGDFRFDVVAVTGDEIEVIESAFSSNEYFI